MSFFLLFDLRDSLSTLSSRISTDRHGSEKPASFRNPAFFPLILSVLKIPMKCRLHPGRENGCWMRKLGLIILECPHCERQYKREVGEMSVDPDVIPKFMYHPCKRCKTTVRMKFVKVFREF